MRLRELLSALASAEVTGEADPEILGLAYDSREVRPGWLFAAMEGQHTDGHRHIGGALERGAVAVLHSRRDIPVRPGVAYVRVEDPRRSLSPLAAAFHAHPSAGLQVVGVTGTDGKSTTVFLIHQLLEALGRKSGFQSTVSFQTGGAVQKNTLRQSTPEASEVQALLAAMVASGRRYAVLEATSHGLSERTNRLGDVRFEAAVCTNITHEHLEFHGSFEQYRSDKANLFRALDREWPPVPTRAAPRVAPDCFGVVNRDDPSHDYLAGQTRAPVHTYSIRSPEAELSAHGFQGDLGGSHFTLRWHGGQASARLTLPGLFNVENLLAAALTVHRLTEAPYADLVPCFPALRGVEGRLQPVAVGQPFCVLVDYAHTPEAFARLLPFIRGLTHGRLIAVFGSAGERDTVKRPLQGETASRYCDLLVLTDEDPRGEDPLEIIRGIAAGCRPGPELLQEPDRRKAIRAAFQQARPGDTVLLLGKGHEGSIIYPDGPHPWNEAEAAREALRAMGFES